MTVIDRRQRRGQLFGCGPDTLAVIVMLPGTGIGDVKRTAGEFGEFRCAQDQGAEFITRRDRRIGGPGIDGREFAVGPV